MNRPARTETARRTRHSAAGAFVVAVSAVAASTAPPQWSAAATAGAPPAVRISTTALAEGCPVSDAQVESEVEPHVASNPTDRRNLVAVWQQDRSLSGGARATGVAASFDGGKSWTASAVPGIGCAGTTDAKASDPWVSFGVDGTAYVAALVSQENRADIAFTDDPSGVAVATSTDGGRTWSTAKHAYTAVSLDKPTITADPYRAGVAHLTWSQFTWYTCHVQCNLTTAMMYKRTDDGGRTWSEPRVVAVSPNPFEQMSDPEILVQPDGTLVAMHVIFEYSNDVPGNIEPCLAPKPGDLCGRQTIRAQTSTDGGRTWSAPVVVAGGRYLPAVQDPETNSSGQRGTVRASWGWYPFARAAGRDGRVYAAWINRHFDPPPLDARKAEIQLAVSSDAGRSWVVRSVIPLMSDAFVPTLAVDSDGVIAVTWYDLRSDRLGDASLSTDVWFAASRDGGGTWRQRRIGGPFDLRQAPIAGSLGGPLYFVGDYEGLTETDTGFVAVFVQAPPAATVGASDVFAVRVPS